MKKLFLAILTVLLLFNSNVAYATNYLIDENGKLYSPEWYNNDGKIKLNPTWYEKEGRKLQAEADKISASIPKLFFTAVNGDPVTGEITYPNYSDIVVGDFDLQWVYTPDDAKYETRTGVFHFYIWPADTEEQKGKLPEITPDEPTPPSLTATTVLLASRTAYDINLNNKVSGTSYKWTSSNDKIAKVNGKNGLVTAVSEGTANITCVMTFPDGSAQELTSVVSINYDDNATILSDTALDLDIGDKYTLKVENAPAGGKYKFVSSDKSIVKVGTTNGKVTAVSSGDAYITCTITADNQVIVLRCDVSVSE